MERKPTRPKKKFQMILMNGFIYVDGYFGELGSREGVILQGPNREMSKHALCFNFKTSNNKIMYNIVIVGLTLDYCVNYQEISN